MHWLDIQTDLDSGDRLNSADREAAMANLSTAPMAFQLPCPSDCLIELTIALAIPDTADKTKQLHQLLRLNPSLLIFALAEFRRSQGKPAKHANQLVKWCRSNLLRVLGQQTFAPVALKQFRIEKPKQLFRGFLRARGHAKTKLRLGQALKRLTTLNADQRKSILNHIARRSFRLDSFQAKRVRAKSTLADTLGHWQSDNFGNLSIRSIVQLAAHAVEQEVAFQHRLQTEKLASMMQLAYGASHEINNPLANVATRSQSLLAEEQHPEKRNKLAVIYQQTMRAHEMISDMMLFANPPQLDKRSVSVRRLLRRFIGEQDNLLPCENSDIKLSVFIGPAVDRANVDASHLMVVLENLVRNAREAICGKAKSTGEIELHVDVVASKSRLLPAALKSTNRDFLQVSAWDNGIGVDQRVRQHLFDPFFSGREAGRGLGFGLPKVWRIARLHGGDVVLDESCKEGTRFILWLPIEGDDAK
jgi:signal transduction histidine kinase